MNDETSPATPGWKLVPVELTREMGEAFLRATGFWAEAHEPDTENGQPVECGITQQDADACNEEALKDFAAAYAKALAAAPTPLQAEMQKPDQFHLADNAGQRATVSEAVDALHAAIMNLPCAHGDYSDENGNFAYKIGHRNARHAAAELVAAFASSGPSEKEVGAAPLPVQGQDTMPTLEPRFWKEYAERYQFVREWWFGFKDANLRRALSPDELDAAIDAALRASSAPTTKG